MGGINPTCHIRHDEHKYHSNPSIWRLKLLLCSHQKPTKSGSWRVVCCGRSACLTYAQRVFIPHPHGQAFVKKMFATGAVRTRRAHLDPASDIALLKFFFKDCKNLRNYEENVVLNCEKFRKTYVKFL